jgi:hypothetical protein
MKGQGECGGLSQGAKSDYRGEMGLSQRERDYRNAETVCRTG